MPDTEMDANAEAPSSSEASDVAAESSPASEAASEPSLNDMIGQALGEEDPAPSDEQGAEASEAESQETEDKGDLPDDPTEDELKDAKPRTRERIEQLLEQRRDLRAEADSLKPKAEQWDKIEAFRTAHGMTPESVGNAVQIAALIESDPARALQVLTPVFQSLQQRAGEVLPDDFEQRVRQGEISRSDALRIHRAETSRKHMETQRQEQQRREAERQQQTQAEAFVTGLANASTEWDRQQAASDPDWSSKREMVANTVHRLMAAEPPKDAGGMVTLLEKAKQEVDGFLKPYRQQKPAVDRDPDGASSRSATPREPKDVMDVVNMALGDAV